MKHKAGRRWPRWIDTVIATFGWRLFIDQLVAGTAYVYRAPGAPDRLAVGTLVEVDPWTDVAQMPGEVLGGALFHILEDDSGRCRYVPRADLLWAFADHAAIQTAASMLGLPIAPHAARGRPSWVFGRERLEVRDMIELGQLAVRQ